MTLARACTETDSSTVCQEYRSKLVSTSTELWGKPTTTAAKDYRRLEEQAKGKGKPKRGLSTSDKAELHEASLSDDTALRVALQIIEGSRSGMKRLRDEKKTTQQVVRTRGMDTKYWILAGLGVVLAVAGSLSRSRHTKYSTMTPIPGEDEEMQNGYVDVAE